MNRERSDPSCVVLVSGEKNIALNRPAYQSSDNTNKYRAHQAVDGVGGWRVSSWLMDRSLLARGG